eukprot:scaffold492_cov347-Prasinococcus_capsulatus_cf.AAC.7
MDAAAWSLEERPRATRGVGVHRLEEQASTLGVESVDCLQTHRQHHDDDDAAAAGGLLVAAAPQQGDSVPEHRPARTNQPTNQPRPPTAPHHGFPRAARTPPRALGHVELGSPPQHHDDDDDHLSSA